MSRHTLLIERKATSSKANTNRRDYRLLDLAFDDGICYDALIYNVNLQNHLGDAEHSLELQYRHHIFRFLFSPLTIVYRLRRHRHPRRHTNTNKAGRSMKIASTTTRKKSVRFHNDVMLERILYVKNHCAREVLKIYPYVVGMIFGLY